jgi:hypothetical protein
MPSRAMWCDRICYEILVGYTLSYDIIYIGSAIALSVANLDMMGCILCVLLWFGCSFMCDTILCV